MAGQVTLCNLFLFEVKDISLGELHQESEDVIKAMTSYLDEDTKYSEKLHFYKMDSGNRLKSIKSYQDIPNGSNIIAVDLFQLGQSCLNQNSFNSASGNSLDRVTERRKALKLFFQFVKTIQSKNGESCRVDMATDCLDSKYIEENLTSKTSHDPCEYVPQSNIETDSNVLDTVVPDTVVLDNLISACKSLNQRACKIMHDEIKLHSWAEILKKGCVITCILDDNNISCEIPLHSDVFEFINTGSKNNNQQGDGELEYLGAGAFGKVYKYTTMQSKITLVIKQSKVQLQGKSFDSRPGWYREAYHTNQLSHENVIKYYGKPILYGENCYSIMEFGGTSLNDLYYNENKMAPKKIWQAMLQISSAIDYLHIRVIIHRDIRTPNVTVSISGVYKLIDFGLSSQKTGMNSKCGSNTDLGNHLWKSPESCSHMLDPANREAPGRSSDIWMFGVFVLEMLAFPDRPKFFLEYAERPYPFITALTEKKINLHDENCDHEIRNILLRCLEFDDTERVKSRELLKLCNPSLNDQ